MPTTLHVTEPLPVTPDGQEYQLLAKFDKSSTPLLVVEGPYKYCADQAAIVWQIMKRSNELTGIMEDVQMRYWNDRFIIHGISTQARGGYYLLVQLFIQKKLHRPGIDTLPEANRDNLEETEQQWMQDHRLPKGVDLT